MDGFSDFSTSCYMGVLDIVVWVIFNTAGPKNIVLKKGPKEFSAYDPKGQDVA